MKGEQLGLPFGFVRDPDARRGHQNRIDGRRPAVAVDLCAEELATADAMARPPSASLLRGFACPQDERLFRCLETVVTAAPFRHLVTPGGLRMSVATTSCGAWGWISDRQGYRYVARDPDSGRPWPTMPGSFDELATRAAEAAGYPGFHPDSCLINRYEIGAKMTLHQDKDERDFSAPIVSVSLGLPAIFLFGGAARTAKAQRIPLVHGDVVVWGGSARRYFHGILPIKPGLHPFTGPYRINLTFRKAG